MGWPRAERAAEVTVLTALQCGAVLKVHRTMDGAKIHKLHRHGESPTVVASAVVQRLIRKKLLQSNMKFPAATYLLTNQAVDLMADCKPQISSPLTAYNHRSPL